MKVFRLCTAPRDPDNWHQLGHPDMKRKMHAWGDRVPWMETLSKTPIGCNPLKTNILPVAAFHLPTRFAQADTGTASTWIIDLRCQYINVLIFFQAINRPSKGFLNSLVVSLVMRWVFHGIMRDVRQNHEPNKWDASNQTDSKFRWRHSEVEEMKPHVKPDVSITWVWKCWSKIEQRCPDSSWFYVDFYAISITRNEHEMGQSFFNGRVA